MAIFPLAKQPKLFLSWLMTYLSVSTLPKLESDHMPFKTLQRSIVRITALQNFKVM